MQGGNQIMAECWLENNLIVGVDFRAWGRSWLAVSMYPYCKRSDNKPIRRIWSADRKKKRENGTNWCVEVMKTGSRWIEVRWVGGGYVICGERVGKGDDPICRLSWWWLRDANWWIMGSGNQRWIETWRRMRRRADKQICTWNVAGMYWLDAWAVLGKMPAQQ